MMKKCILIIMPLVLALVLSACSPAEPPIESPADSSTPIGTPADTPLDTPAETPKPYDFSKIRFRTNEIMVIGEIKDIEEYNAKTAELTEACKDYYHEEASVAYVMIAAVFRYGCEMTDAELTQVGLGKFQRVKGDDLSDRAVFEVWINHAGEDTFAAALELSHNENVEHIEIYLMYSVSVPAEH